MAPQGLPAAHPANTDLQAAGQTACEQPKPNVEPAADTKQPAQQVRTSSRAIKAPSEAATSAAAAGPDTSASGPVQGSAAQPSRGQMAELPLASPDPAHAPPTLAPQSPAHAATSWVLLQERPSPASQRQCQPKASPSSGERTPPPQDALPQPRSPAEHGIAVQQADGEPAPRSPSKLAGFQAQPPVSTANTLIFVMGPTLELEQPVLEAARVDGPGVAAIAESPALVASPAPEAGSLTRPVPADADKVRNASHSVSSVVLSYRWPASHGLHAHVHT